MAATAPLILNPLPGFRIGSRDAGIDASANVGSAIVAPTGSTLVDVIQNWYKGQPLLLFKFDKTPAGAASDYWYTAEQINPKTTKLGAHFNTGDVVATFAASGTGTESGWGSPTTSSRTLAGAPGHSWTRDSSTPDANSFISFFGIGGTSHNIGYHPTPSATSAGAAAVTGAATGAANAAGSAVTDAVKAAFSWLLDQIVGNLKYAALALVVIVGGFMLLARGASRATHAGAA